jgi:hypothetical protein
MSHILAGRITFPNAGSRGFFKPFAHRDIWDQTFAELVHAYTVRSIKGLDLYVPGESLPQTHPRNSGSKGIIHPGEINPESRGKTAVPYQGFPDMMTLRGAL